MLKYYFQTFFLFVTQLCSLTLGHTNTTCLKNAKEPPDLNQRYFQLLTADNSTHPLEESFYMIPKLADSEPYDGKNTRHKNHRALLYGTRKCRLDLKSDLLMDRSSCPWYLEMIYDDNRYPKAMVTARCKCSPNKGCFNVQGKRDRRPNNNIDRPKCAPVTIQRKVLRKVLNKDGTKRTCDGNNEYIYSQSLQTISTGCTCGFRQEDIKTRDTPKTEP